MPKKSSFARQAAGFIETMDCLPVSKLHEGPEWTYETKLDGYRLEAVRRGGRTTLYFRRQNIPNQKFHYIATALQDLPNDAVALKVGSSFWLQARRVDPQRILGWQFAAGRTSCVPESDRTRAVTLQQELAKQRTQMGQRRWQRYRYLADSFMRIEGLSMPNHPAARAGHRGAISSAGEAGHVAAFLLLPVASQ
jgi:hypothetical protein